ncbi:MAG: ABC transporter permease [Rhodovarius sp.]|nr:ABC transporter permease [Rhodovarius sp.]MCX7933076.1 ABC transporter permease [Rhodovarius sp.]MDW8314208.1 ABC transporter permease [Rhodovarius sp.]
MAALWLALLVAAPLAVIAAISLAVPDEGLPPFRLGAPLADNEAWPLLAADGFYAAALLRSLLLAAVTAGCCLLLSYPMALGLLRLPARLRPWVVGLILLPFAIGFVLRMAAWVGLLRDSGPINAALLALGLIAEPLPLLYGWSGLFLGMVHSYLIFALLPLYAALSARDPRLEEAAADLGASPAVVFFTVTLPASAAAAGAAFLLVFIPAAGEFVVPELLGPPEALLAGRAIWLEFFQSRDWPLAAAASLALLLVLVGPILLWQRLGRAP